MLEVLSVPLVSHSQVVAVTVLSAVLSDQSQEMRPTEVVVGCSSHLSLLSYALVSLDTITTSYQLPERVFLLLSGTYNDDATSNATSCKPCPTGTTTDQAGSDSAVDCKRECLLYCVQLHTPQLSPCPTVGL